MYDMGVTAIIPVERTPTMKTDDAAIVGQHKFEVAGLGKAPFRFVGVSEKVFQACPGAPVKPGGTCDYCGAGIRDCFHVRSADGKEFVVGCDCINKVGDAGLIKAYKTSPEFRKLQAEKRKAKAVAVRQAIDDLIASSAGKLAAIPHPSGFSDRKTGQPLTALDWAQWMQRNCGAAGRARLIKQLKAMLLAPNGDTITTSAQKGG